ncbi:MAG: RNA methyltransferase [Bacteroidales bacterium]|nr:RNA methyltransferase [Bacteroidales bacterium]MBN2697222.1 RNA methyltransferase [Bacteroidales bacterium]
MKGTTQKAEIYHAKTLKGLEPWLASELIELGAEKVTAVNRGVNFSGGRAMLYKVNVASRLALRVLMPLSTFLVTDEKALYRNVQKINWSDYMDNKMSFAVDAVVFSNLFRNSHFVSLKVKDAIADQFRDRTGLRPSVNTKDPDLLVNIHISEQRATLSLDSSGESLHKRGYRSRNFEAPLNEVLAAGMVMISGWKGETPFIDPMCGSGTIAIEAALIASGIPPGIFRKAYGFEKWKDFDPALMRGLVERLPRERAVTVPIIASDISMEAVRATREHARRAGIEDLIRIEKRDFISYEPWDRPVTLIMNPPYGERMNPGDLAITYQMIGATLKHKFPGSEAWILSSNRMAIKQIGLKHSDRKILFNGPIECQYLNYRTFPGTLKEHKQNINQ